MVNNQITKLVYGYRQSAVFIAAYDIGIIKNLHNKAITIKYLSKQIGVNETKLLLILIYLKHLGIVEKVKDTWKLTEIWLNNYKMLEDIFDVIKYEKNIFQKWMYPAQIEQALYAPEGERNFDLEGFEKEEQILYDKTMYGRNLKILGLHLMRQLRGIKNPMIIEYGRSRDNILNALAHTGYQFAGYCMPEDEVLQDVRLEWSGKYEIVSQSKQNIKVDIVIMYNSIHYYDNEILKQKLTQIKRILNRDAIFILIDIFISTEESDSVNYLVDWITHGGVNFITLESAEEMFQENGFSIWRKIELKEINSNILLMHMQ